MVHINVKVVSISEKHAIEMLIGIALGSMGILTI